MFNSFLNFLNLIAPTKRGPTPLDRRLDKVRDERRRLEHTKPPQRPESPSRQRLNERLERVKSDRERDEREREDERNRNDPEWRYLNESEQVRTPESSNVSAFWYEIKDQNLMVQFHDGSLYKYTSVPPRKALEFYRAPSRGGAVWDYLRIRGTRLGHQHPYYMIIGPTRGAGRQISHNFGTRKWESTPKSAAKHGQQAAKESGWAAAKARSRKK